MVEYKYEGYHGQSIAHHGAVQYMPWTVSSYLRVVALGGYSMCRCADVRGSNVNVLYMMHEDSIMYLASCMTSHLFDEPCLFALHGSWAHSAQFTVGTIKYTQARSAVNLILLLLLTLE